MISKEIKEKYPFKEEYETLESYFKEYQKRNILIIRTRPEDKKNFGRNCITYLCRLSYKSFFLFSGFLENINLQNPSVLFLILRAHFETTAALGYFLYKLKEFYNNIINFDQIYDILYKLSCGSKDLDHINKNPSVPQSINIMTMIQKSDKLICENIKKFDDESEDHITLERIYTELSEACHPNSTGLLFGTSVIDRNEVFFSEKSTLGDIDQFHYLIQNMIISSSLYFALFEECSSILNKNENVPKIIR